MSRTRSCVARIVATGVVASLAAALAYAGIVGVFQGRIVQPKGMEREESILYVRSRNGMARKVKVEKAVVVEYDEDVPEGQRRKEPRESLCDDTLVRVTAEQSDKEDGDWKAINILILAEPELPSSPTARMQWASFVESPGPMAQTSGAAQENGAPKASEKPYDGKRTSQADEKAGQNATRKADRKSDPKKEGAEQQARSGTDEPKNQRKNGTNGFCRP